MIREVCSCGAEFETYDSDAVELVKTWRRTHKHSDKPSKADSRDMATLTNTDVALGFQALYDPYNDEEEE